MVVDVLVAADVSALRHAWGVPAGVVRNEDAVQQTFLRQTADALGVPGCGGFADAVELDPAAGAGEAGVDVEVEFVLGVDPDELFGVEAAFANDVELFERGAAVAGVGTELQAGGLCGEDSGLDDLAAGFVEGSFIDADFDEAGLDAAFESVAMFGDPAVGELLGGFAEGEIRQMALLAGGVETGVGPDFEAGFAAETLQENGVAAEVVGGALVEADAAEAGDFLEFGEDGADDGFTVVTDGDVILGVGEVHKDVFVDEDPALGRFGEGQNGCRGGGEKRTSGHALASMIVPKAKGKRKAVWKRALRWTAIALVGLYALIAMNLIWLRWVDPWFTMVQAQRRVESWFAKGKYQKRRTQVSLAKIAPDLQHAVIAAEDGRFYQHHGIDWQAIEDLIEDDLLEDGKLGRGGSTITQQLVKNLYATTHRSLIRKGLEFAVAPLAELVLPKQRILELYLNNIEWGLGGVFGAEAAAQYHYRLHASQLGREQAARLAVCIPAPRRRRPANMSKSAGVILHRMVQMGW